LRKSRLAANQVLVWAEPRTYPDRGWLPVDDVTVVENTVRKPCIAAIHIEPTQPLRLLLSLPLHVSRHRRRLHGAPAGPLPLALPPPHVARPRLPVHVGPALAVHLVYERCPLIQAEPPLRLRRVEERPAYDGRLCTRSPRVLQRQLRMGRVRRVLQPPFRRLRRDVVRRYRRIQARFQLKQPPPSRVRP
jgi:hypothetical protein